jgi:hypothetical protein
MRQILRSFSVQRFWLKLMMILIISKLAGCKVGGKLKIRGNEVLISESGILFGIPQNGILPSTIIICTSTNCWGH